LAASVRGPLHVIEIAKSGVHIVTLTYKVLEQLFHHPLTDKGLEQFLSDHRKAFEMANV
jgi:transaldolase